MHPTRGTGQKGLSKRRVHFIGKKTAERRRKERERGSEKDGENSWSPAKRKRRLFILPHDLKVSPVNKVEDIYRPFALFEDWSELQVNSRRFSLWR